VTGKDADPVRVGKKAKREKYLGPATVVRPALIGAGVLLVIQVAMQVFLKA
jgi:hypothetical protein